MQTLIVFMALVTAGLIVTVAYLDSRLLNTLADLKDEVAESGFWHREHDRVQSALHKRNTEIAYAREALSATLDMFPAFVAIRNGYPPSQDDFDKVAARFNRANPQALRNLLETT